MRTILPFKLFFKSFNYCYHNTNYSILHTFYLKPLLLVEKYVMLKNQELMAFSLTL